MPSMLRVDSTGRGTGPRIVHQDPNWTRLDCHSDDGFFALVAMGCYQLAARRGADYAGDRAGLCGGAATAVAAVYGRWLQSLDRLYPEGVS
jgi:hypothetical protein